MSNTSYVQIARDGLWNNNAALVQILGMCPMMAITNTTVNAIGMGMATTITLMSTNLVVSYIRNMVTPEIRIPVYVILIAAIVTAIEMTMNAYLHGLYLILGIFIPLIVTNCAVLARAEAFASRNSPLRSMMDGLMTGLGYSAVLITLGAMREAVGQGTILAHANLMFGQGTEWMTVTVFGNYHGFLLAILPPGAFIGLGLLVALKNKIDAQRKRPQTAAVPVAAPAPSMGH